MKVPNMELLNALFQSQTIQPPFTQTAAFTTNAGNTVGWPPVSEGVLVWSDVSCYVAVGENVVASTNSLPIPPNTPIPIKVPQGTGGTWRVSAVQLGATGGTVYCRPINSK